MRHKLTRIVVTSLAFLACNAFALQQFKVKDGDTITATVSQNEMSQIKAGNGVKLVKIWGVNGVLQVKPDVKNGIAYIKPMQSAPQSFSFFVQDSNDNTYTIIATQSSIPSEVIVLETTSTKMSPEAERHYKASNYSKKITSLMKAMMLGKRLNGYAEASYKKNVPLWSQTHIMLRQTYQGMEFSGEVYTLKNVTQDTLTFKETEFQNFGTGVRAISLKDLSVKAGKTTFLYIVRAAQAKQGD